LRVNVYAEEMTGNVELITKTIDGEDFTGVRFWLYLPVTTTEQNAFTGEKKTKFVQGPFIHRPGDDDSSAVTFWGKTQLRGMLTRGLQLLDQHHAGQPGYPELGPGVLIVDHRANEVIVNHPDLHADADGVGHIVFSVEEARNFAASVLRAAREAEAEAGR
jgi:hypothetical protein